MDKRFSRPYTDRGVIMPLRSSPFVSLRRHTNTHQTSSISCESTKLLADRSAHDFCDSADLEITVQMLVQVDKLVQLIESPVFTCTLVYFLSF